MPALTYGSESLAMKTNNKKKIASTEIRMLHGILGVSRLEHIRNVEIRRLQSTRSWIVYEENNVARRTMNLALPRDRRRRRPRKTWK